MKVAILRHGNKSTSSKAVSASIGRKLRRLALILEDPTKIEIVDKRFFGRTSERNSIFGAYFVGDNGKKYHVTIMLDRPAADGSFEGKDDGPEVGG